MYPEVSYEKVSVCFFCKVQEEWGELSNMSNKYGVRVNGISIRNTEALYQACRFPDNSEAQEKILSGKSGMSSKMTSKHYRAQGYTRSDWKDVRIDIMRFCLTLKLYQNPPLRNVLLATANKPIVELSHKDKFWGTVEENGILIGQNVLGRMWMEIREDIINGIRDYRTRPTTTIQNFILMGNAIT